MANSDVRAAAASLDAAIQALDASALEAAEFTRGAHDSYAPGLAFHLGRQVELIKNTSAELVLHLERIRQLE